jgi:hypothetical protein
MSAFTKTIFSNEPILAEINSGVEKLQTRIVYPTGNPLSPAGDTEIGNGEYSFEVKPPAGYTTSCLAPASSDVSCSSAVATRTPPRQPCQTPV